MVKFEEDILSTPKKWKTLEPFLGYPNGTRQSQYQLPIAATGAQLKSQRQSQLLGGEEWPGIMMMEPPNLFPISTIAETIMRVECSQGLGAPQYAIN